MVLECLCPWEGNLSMVSWTKVPDKDPLAVLHPEYGVAFSHHYRERIEFLRNTPMDGSIVMRNITHQDIGLYHCSVQTFPQGSWTRDVQVEDTDEPPEDQSVETPTLAPIEADTEVVAELNENLTIICNHEHKGTVYKVTVEKSTRGQPWEIVGSCLAVNGGMSGEEYTKRVRVSCQDSLGVSLQLVEVAEEDEGLYRCGFSTDTGVQTTTVLLTVPRSGDFSLSEYMMYIYIGAGVAGLILVTVFLILALRHRKRNLREEYRVQLHPAQRQQHCALQHNFYGNIPAMGRLGNRPRQIKDCPVYTNLQTIRGQAQRVAAR
ncbi:CD226 antigen isoform X2 [Lampris incognitus]|nr:CD226 antigen isoform X2 [Lampris incognitus]